MVSERLRNTNATMFKLLGHSHIVSCVVGETENINEMRFDMSTEKKLLRDRIEAAEILGISPSKLDQLRRDGLIASVLFGRTRRFAEEDLKKFIDAHRNNTPTTKHTETQFVC
jgi:excisionase family DNA binding protein